MEWNGVTNGIRWFSLFHAVAVCNNNRWLLHVNCNDVYKLNFCYNVSVCCRLFKTRSSQTMPADRDEVHSSSSRKGLFRVAIFGRLNSYNLYLETAFFSPEEIESWIHGYVPLPQYQRLFLFFCFC